MAVSLERVNPMDWNDMLGVLLLDPCEWWYYLLSIITVNVSGHAIGVKEVASNELLELFAGHFPISVLVDDLNIGCDIGRSRLEAFIHGSIAVDKPFSNLDCLADSVSISVVGLDDLSALLGNYLARLRH